MRFTLCSLIFLEPDSYVHLGDAAHSNVLPCVAIEFSCNYAPRSMWWWEFLHNTCIFMGHYANLVGGIPCQSMFYFFFVKTHTSLQNSPLWSSKGGWLPSLASMKQVSQKETSLLTILTWSLGHCCSTEKKKNKRFPKYRFRSLTVSWGLYTVSIWIDPSVIWWETPLESVAIVNP